MGKLLLSPVDQIQVELELAQLSVHPYWCWSDIPFKYGTKYKSPWNWRMKASKSTQHKRPASRNKQFTFFLFYRLELNRNTLRAYTVFVGFCSSNFYTLVIEEDAELKIYNGKAISWFTRNILSHATCSCPFWAEIILHTIDGSLLTSDSLGDDTRRT